MLMSYCCACSSMSDLWERRTVFKLDCSSVCVHCDLSYLYNICVYIMFVFPVLSCIYNYVC